MIDFIAGVCFGYFCRPVVEVIIKVMTNAWKNYQNQDKPKQ